MTDLDPLIHAPKRLRVMAMLSAADQVEFSYLREQLGLTPPDLSKQMKALQEAGYVWGRRSGRGPGSTTWYRMSRTGRKAYDAYVAALRQVLEGPGGPGDEAPVTTVPSSTVSDTEVAALEADQPDDRSDRQQPQ